MPTTISGTTGIDQVQDNTIATADIQNSAVTAVKVADANITAAKLSGAQSGSAPIYGCRAWVSFAGATGAINASGNVSGVVRNSAGDYTITFTTAMQDANYAVQGCSGDVANTTLACVSAISILSGSVRVTVRQSGNVLADYATVTVSVIR